MKMLGDLAPPRRQIEHLTGLHYHTTAVLKGR
jgi:hypothetical protein